MRFAMFVAAYLHGGLSVVSACWLSVMRLTVAQHPEVAVLADPGCAAREVRILGRSVC